MLIPAPRSANLDVSGRYLRGFRTDKISSMFESFGRSRRRLILLFLGGLPIVALVLICAGVWYFSSGLIAPSWQTPGIAKCEGYRRETFGPACGNLAENHRFKYVDVQLPTPRGYALPGWYVPRAANPGPASDAATAQPARTGVFYAHGGGSDRREGYRYIEYLLGRGFDVYLFDYSCHGEAPCAVRGLSFGEREHKDIVDILHYLKGRHARVYAMGTSMGAASLLTALPVADPIDAVVAENPLHSFERLALETRAAPAFLPTWFRRLTIALTLRRAHFSGEITPAHALHNFSSKMPIVFLHSKADTLVPYTHSVDLHREYQGPKHLELFETGRHARLWLAHNERFRQLLDTYFPD
jgi:alpha-beta hydrolase superfamily lysophospholipase